MNDNKFVFGQEVLKIDVLPYIPLTAVTSNIEVWRQHLALTEVLPNCCVGITPIRIIVKIFYRNHFCWFGLKTCGKAVQAAIDLKLIFQIQLSE
jgi:hypothetical protein